MKKNSIDTIGQVCLADIINQPIQTTHRLDHFYVARKALLKKLYAKRQADKASK